MAPTTITAMTAKIPQNRLSIYVTTPLSFDYTMSGRDFEI